MPFMSFTIYNWRLTSCQHAHAKECLKRRNFRDKKKAEVRQEKTVLKKMNAVM